MSKREPARASAVARAPTESFGESFVSTATALAPNRTREGAGVFEAFGAQIDSFVEGARFQVARCREAEALCRRSRGRTGPSFHRTRALAERSRAVAPISN